ncbi:MAG: two-component regulator propeller domain-containing protein [Flavobacteriales bacterium]
MARFLLSLLGLFTLVLRAQPGALHFQHLTVEDGLTDNAVTCVFEDHAGYIWIGTERGLNRYDGQRIERIDNTSNLITAVAQGGDGVIWFTTLNAGLGRVDPSTRKVTRFQHDPNDPRSLPTNSLNHVLVLDDSLLVLSSRGRGAIWYHLRSGAAQCLGFRPVKVNDRGDTIARAENDWCHTAVRLDDGHIVLLMLRSPGPCVVDAQTGRLEATLAAAKGPITNALLDDGALYMGGWMSGMYRADPEKPEAVSYFPMDEEITSMVQWDDRCLLAATKVSGLIWIGKDGGIMGRSRHVRSDPSSLSSDRTTCLLRDRAKNLWVGTAKGVSVYAPSV